MIELGGRQQAKATDNKAILGQPQRSARLFAGNGRRLRAHQRHLLPTPVGLRA